jgi:hypothetical protein
MSKEKDKINLEEIVPLLYGFEKMAGEVQDKMIKLARRLSATQLLFVLDKHLKEGNFEIKINRDRNSYGDSPYKVTLELNKIQLGTGESEESFKQDINEINRLVRKKKLHMEAAGMDYNEYLDEGLEQTIGDISLKTLIEEEILKNV